VSATRVSTAVQPTSGGRCKRKGAEERKDAAKEALNAGAFAQFVGGPGRRETRSILLPLGVPGDDGDRAERGVDPRDEA